MKQSRASKVALLSVVLALTLSVMDVAPARALGPFGHNSVARDANDLLPASDLKTLLDQYLGLVLAGSVYPDWCIKGTYENFPGDPDEVAHSARFVASYLEYIRLHFTAPYDTEEERKSIAFLFGLIVHNVSDPVFHRDYLPHAHDIDNTAPPDLLAQYGIGPHQLVEMAVDSFAMTRRDPLGYGEVDWSFFPYDPIFAAYQEQGIGLEWGDLQLGWSEYRTLSTLQVDLELLAFLELLAALPNTLADFYTYEPGGMADGVEQVKTAWLAAWDILNDPDYSGVNHVRPDGSDTADCQSWESACTLQRGLSHYVPGMETWVAAGTYKPSASGDRTATFKVGLGLKVYGGFPDTGNPVFDNRDPAAYPTILSGDLLGNDNGTVQFEEPTRADNSYHVVTVTEGIVLDGFIVEGGNANGDPLNSEGAGYDNGGGVYNRTSVTLANATLRDNSAKNSGGGMYSYQFNKPLLTNVTFENNSARYGGGVSNYLGNGSLSRLINVTFNGNSAVQYGGGIYNSACSTLEAPASFMSSVLTHATFSGNSAVTGGGIYNGTNSALLVTNAIVANSPSGGDCAFPGGVLGSESKNNLIQQAGAACGLVDGSSGNIVGGEPLLGSLGNYGGATPTIPLLPGSPAIDSADLDICTSPYESNGANGSDQRGATRPKGSACDIGAYEFTEPLHVNPAGVDAGDCQSWAAACSLQHALSIALNGDELWVASGLYTPTASPADRTAAFQLKRGMAVYGGFYGTETSRSQRDPAAYPTILSGDIGHDDTNTDGNTIAETTGDIQGSNSYHVVLGASSATLDGFIVTAGQADGTNPDDQGGGMRNRNCNSLILTDLVFRGNAAINGGGMSNYYSNPTVTDVTFGGNTAPAGGGMYNLHSSPAVTGATFDGNSASDSGGGMYNLISSNPTLTSVIFNGNSAQVFGGGIYNHQSDPTITEAVFSGNAAGYGAGMFNYDSSPTVRNAAFSGNTAANYSGGMYNSLSDPALTNVTFSGNSAAYYGGAMLNDGSSPTLTNVTFSGNSVDAGQTFTKGGAIFNYSDSDPQIRNTIFWGNTAPTGAQIYTSADGSAPVVVYSIVQGGYSGEGNLTTDPQLGTLGDHGGFTQTIPLLPGSSAVNNGNPSFCTVGADQRGVNYVGPCDIGAYEYDGPAPTLFAAPEATGSGDCTSWASACTLQSALSAAASGYQIWVAAGLHTPTTSKTDRAATFLLKSGVAVYGGFEGSETALSQRDPAAHLTILSGDIDGNDSQWPVIFEINGAQYNGTNSYHVVTGATGATLDGFTVTAGAANVGTDCTGNACGGGMYNGGSNPTVTKVIFSGNLAVQGGGMYNDSASPTLTEVVFVTNKATVDGGGMYNNGGAPVLTDVTFSTNFALDGRGGGMRNNQSSPAVSDVSFSDNSARWGGGVSNYQSSPVFMDVSFSGNSGTDNGGGMGNHQSSPTITNAAFSGNWAGAGAGMHNYENSNPGLTNVTFSGNSAAVSGGGLENMLSSPRVTSVTFQGNSATWGGGMNNHSGSNPVLANVTFSQNVASDNGGGINNDASHPSLTNVTIVGNTGTLGGAGGIFNYAGSSPFIRNTILWDNAPQQIVTSSGSPSVQYSVVMGGYSGTGNISVNPNLGPLGSYGGFTQTIILGNGSSAIDAGNDTLCAADIGAPGYGAGWHDQRGVVRPDGAHCDIGAFEYQNEYLLTVTSAHGVVDWDPGQNFFHEGDTVRLSATPDFGWSFAGWSGGLTSSSNPAFVTIHGDTAVTANYTENSTATPTGLAGVPGNGLVSLTWNANSETSLRGYKIYYRTAAGGWLAPRLPGIATSYPLTGLTNGTDYVIAISSFNQDGVESAKSADIAATPRTVPDPPTIGTAEPGDGQATVNFTAPARDGGSAITSYTATASPGGMTGTGTASPITVGGLAVNTPYTFTVKATNAVGAGAASAASNSVTLCVYAVTPEQLTVGATAEVGTLTVTTGAGCPWTAASDVSWVTVTSGTSGSGSGAVHVFVAPNQGVARAGTVTVGGTAVSVEQASTALHASFVGIVNGVASENPHGPAPLEVSFDASGSSGPNPVVSYHWDFGDGESADTTEASTDHRYETTGSRQVTLTITDELGGTDSTRRIVSVADVVQTATNAADLQAALSVAQANDMHDIIRLAGGSYPLTGNADAPFAYAATESKDLVIEGGWTPDFSQRAANIPTELLNDLPTPASGNGGVLRLTAVGGVTVDGLSIGGGKSTGSGGGLYIMSAGAIVVGNTRVLGNTASGTGGGLYLETTAGDVWLSGSVVRGNAGSVGAGAVVKGRSAYIYANEVAGNEATGADGGLQAAAAGGELIVSNNTIYGNHSATGGAGLSVTATGTGGLSLLDVHNNIVFGNGAAPDFTVAPDCSYLAGFVDLDIVNNSFGSFDLCADHLLDGSNIAADFSGRAWGEIRLAPTDTALIDQGTSRNAPLEDFEGDAIPLDGDWDTSLAPDIGADEYNPVNITGPTWVTLSGSGSISTEGGSLPIIVTLDMPAKRDMVLYLTHADTNIDDPGAPLVSVTPAYLRILKGTNGAEATVQAVSGARHGTALITAADPSGFAVAGYVGVTVELDATSPSGSVLIGDGAAYTRTAHVTLNLSAEDTGGSGLDVMRFANAGGVTSAWEPYATTKEWVLAGGSGTKTVFVQFRDKAGNVSDADPVKAGAQAYKDEIVFDPTPPTGSLLINGGAAATTTTAVTLNLSAADTGGSGLDAMRFVNSGGTVTDWEPYQTTKAWTLTSAVGTKTVWVQFRDRAGNLSDADPTKAGAQSYKDDIVYDPPPTGSILINNGAASTTSLAVTLDLSATDLGSGGLDAMRFTNGGGTVSAWEPYATTKAWTLTGGVGTKTVFVQFRDKGGNVSDADPVRAGAQSYKDTITYSGP